MDATDIIDPRQLARDIERGGAGRAFGAPVALLAARGSRLVADWRDGRIAVADIAGALQDVARDPAAGALAATATAARAAVGRAVVARIRAEAAMLGAAMPRTGFDGTEPAR